VVELQSIVLQKIRKEKRWRHTKTPLHVKFEHHDFGGVRKRHWGLEVSPPSRLGLRSHSALAFHNLDVRILNTGFLPVPMEVLGDLLFFVLSFFLLSLAIRCGVIWVRTRHLIFGFGHVVLWVQIRHPRMFSLD
jgi:hypothetical protein